MRARWLLLAPCVSACVIDFDRYLASSAGTDGGFFADRTSTDAPPPPPPPPVDAGPPCTAPYLLAAVENLSGQSGAHGTIARVELPSGRRCRDLGMGVLPEQPMALHTLADGKVAVASRNQVNVFDPVSGATVISVPVDDSNTLPVDVFPLQTGSEAGFGVAYLNVTTSDVRLLRVFTLTRQLDALSTSPVPTGTSSVTAHPREPASLLAVRRDTGETLTVRPPFVAGMRTTEPFASTIVGARRVFALPSAQGGHVTWVAATSGSTGNAALRLTTPATGNPPFVAMGPTTFPCAAAQCREIVHAVPDPTDGAPLALCEGTATASGIALRYVVRGGTDPTCVLLDGATLPARSRISALAVVR